MPWSGPLVGNVQPLRPSVSQPPTRQLFRDTMPDHVRGELSGAAVENVTGWQVYV